MSRSLAEQIKTWEEQVLAKALAKAPERKPVFHTTSGMPVRPLYTPADVGNSYAERLGFPGQPPYTRGVQPTMYRGRLWTMRQYAGFGTAAESNARFKYLLEHGTTGLSVAFDLPTQIGYDADEPVSEGEVGKVGVAISSLRDMEVLLDGLPLDQITTSMTINATGAILLAMYVAVAKQRDIPLDKIGGTIQNDILKEYIARGTYRFPVEPSLRLITDVLAYCSEHVPRWNPISISGYHIREAGSTAAQELAFTLADGIAYVQAAIAAGLDVDAFAGRLSFFFNAHNNLLEEVAKYRAARRMWYRIMDERFGAKQDRSKCLRFHTQTAGSALTSQQIENNIVRVTLQALAGVLGGTQSLHTNAKDEALALPNEAGVQVALRTQQIIAYESGVADTVDPLGGAYYVEALTDRLEADAWAYIERIDALGGAVEAIKQGYIQREIQDAAYDAAKATEQGELVVVGLNRFQTADEPEPDNLLEVDPGVRDQQTAALATLRAERDADRVEAALRVLRETAEGSDNLMAPIIAAVEAYATMGEICRTLEGVFGTYKEALF